MSTFSKSRARHGYCFESLAAHQMPQLGRSKPAVQIYRAGGDAVEARGGAKFGRVVPAGESYRGKQGPAYTPGVSAETVGSLGLWLGSVVLPPGGRTKAHVHESHESALSSVAQVRHQR